MKKEYINPSIKMSMFDSCIATEQQVMVSGIDGEAAAQAAIVNTTAERFIMKISESKKVLEFK